MPPVSNARKTSAATAALPYADDSSTGPRRTTSGRAVRANTSRPSNYYARPFVSFAPNDDDPNAVDGDPLRPRPSQFLPGIQFFSDAIVALPKEVMRQFTLLKDVEAKVHGPNERHGEVVGEIMQFPVPSRKNAHAPSVEDRHNLLTFTANNSATGSASASLVNGTAPNANHVSAQNSVSGSIDGEETATANNEEDLERRKKFHELRALTHSLLPNLDEKNVVLAEANRILAQQLLRIDSVMPHINKEISDDARLGSMRHWAYSDNRQRKPAASILVNRRDVAATNSLAAAASALHESDIAQARRDAVRETTREKHKGKGREQVDSDFEERPKKTHAKIAKATKNKATGQPLAAASAVEPAKKRKLDKGVAAAAVERAPNAMTKAMRIGKETSRSIPAGESVKKMPKTKPVPPPPKKKAVNSGHGSPAMASSPLHSSFNATSVEPPGGRPQSARLRQNSAATNLRHERPAEEDVARPIPAAGKADDDRPTSKRKTLDLAAETMELDESTKATDREESVQQEDIDAGDNPYISRSTSNSGKDGRGSTAGTPQDESVFDVPGMVRARSTRSMRGNHDESSAEPQGPYRHRRNHSHLVKQLAPFNRSPDLNRVRLDDMDDDLDSVNGRQAMREEAETSLSPTKRQSRSRRNTGNLIAASSPLVYKPGDEDAIMLDDEPEPTVSEDVPDFEEDALLLDADVEGDIEEDEDSEPGDPDDPDEPKYCYCNRGSYGEMIACDNEQCPREWFHLECTGLREPPDEAAKWYCDECKPLFVTKGRGKGRGGNRKRE